MKVIHLRRETFDDMVSDRPIHELPIVFTGTLEECHAYAAKEGFVWKPSRRMLFGGWFYKAPVLDGPGVSLHPTL